MKNKTWSKWAAIAEIISSVAILITLAYLAIETRQNTDAIHSNTRQASLEAELNIIDRQIVYPHLRPAMRSGSMDGLTDDEIEQIYNHITSMFRIRETNWLQNLNGVMDDETWQVYRNSMVLFISEAPLIRQQWELIS